MLPTVFTGRTQHVVLKAGLFMRKPFVEFPAAHPIWFAITREEAIDQTPTRICIVKYPSLYTSS